MMYRFDEAISPIESAFETDDLFHEEDGYGFFIDTDNEVSDDDQSSWSSLDFDDNNDVGGIEVQVKAEPAECLESCPRILTPLMMQQLADEELPLSCQTKEWTRLYSAARDGDKFWTFLRKVRGHADTVVVAKTRCGQIVGAYTDSQWDRKKKGRSGDSQLYGEGKSFLFSVGALGTSKSWLGSSFDMLDESYGHSRLTVCRNGGDGCYQLCNAEDRSISICSRDENGGSFELSVQDCFSHGSTNLTNGKSTPGDQFDIVDFEVYGFTEMQ